MRTPAICCCACLAAIVIVSGCALPQRLRQADNGSPQYDRVEIVYHVQNGQFSAPTRTLEQAGMDESSASKPDSSGSWSTACLTIAYPHPDEIPGMARATLVLSQTDSPALPKPPTIRERIAQSLNRLATSAEPDACKGSSAHARSSGPDDEIWVLDFPKQQLDLLLADLAGSGFFENQTRPNGGALLQIAVDRGRTQKTWTPEPRLDDVVSRVFREGMLDGFVAVETKESADDPKLKSPVASRE